MALDRVTARIAIAISRRWEAEYTRYLEDCESYRRIGLRPHHCEHGTNLWTDYDNICGPCEDGETMADGVARRTHALAIAKINVAEAFELIDMISNAQRLGVADALDLGMIRRRVSTLLNQSATADR